MLFSLLFGASSALANFARVGALTLNSGENFPACSVIDSAGGFAYFGTQTDPGTIVKVRLSDFTRVGVLTLNVGETFLDAAVIDPVGGFAYFGTQTGPAIVGEGAVVRLHARRYPDLEFRWRTKYDPQ